MTDVDRELFERLPESLRRRLGDGAGFIAHDGGLHVRGACREPAWHSLREDDIPFAEDAVGDQWILRGDQVLRLAAEPGDVEPLGRLEPGQLISVYPPFCTKESADGVSLRPVPADECHAFLWSFAEQLRGG